MQATALQPVSPRLARLLPPLEAYATGVSAHTVQRQTDGVNQVAQDCLIEEIPVSLEFVDAASGEQTAQVMMATPTDLEAFALGFALSEGIVKQASQILDVQVLPVQLGMAVLLTLEPGLLDAVKARQRNQAAASSCGLCGVSDMQTALDIPDAVTARWTIKPERVMATFKQLPALQTLGAQTGAAHAAAFVNQAGEIVLLAEDAGRHNALDKLIGLMAQQGLLAGDGWCAITSRASFEMVQKAARLGFPILAAISAPTALAVRLAHASGLTLCGFVRGQRLSCFSNAQRLDSI